MKRNYFITAIDTDAGKSIVTGILAKYLLSKEIKVVTQKMAQTGCVGFSEDIETHRKIMGTGPLPEDEKGWTCPVILPFPASPDFSARLEGTTIDPAAIRKATEALTERYECVLTEGVGGVMVPLREGYTVLDYLREYPVPVILVTNGRLGSVNHTLLTLDVLSRHGIELCGMVFNEFPETDPAITADTRQRFREYLGKYYSKAVFAGVPRWEPDGPLPELSALFSLPPGSERGKPPKGKKKE